MSLGHRRAYWYPRPPAAVLPQRPGAPRGRRRRPPRPPRRRRRRPPRARSCRGGKCLSPSAWCSPPSWRCWARPSSCAAVSLRPQRRPRPGTHSSRAERAAPGWASTPRPQARVAPAALRVPVPQRGPCPPSPALCPRSRNGPGAPSGPGLSPACGRGAAPSLRVRILAPLPSPRSGPTPGARDPFLVCAKDP